MKIIGATDAKKSDKTRKGRLPSYLRRPLGRAESLHGMKKLLRARGLHTVCESARCPNMGECFTRPTATFMILGDVCTRGCAFCGVDKSRRPLAVDGHEPGNIALAAVELGLRHVVVTSVTRDDLPLGGAEAFAATIRALRQGAPGVTVEVLTPDFGGDTAAIDTVLDAGPDVFNHNIETVPRLYPTVRPEADFRRSLGVLRRAHERGGAVTKSGIMVGLGERREEVRDVLTELSLAGCDAVTIGQYLRPTRDNMEVAEYVSEETFGEYERLGRQAGLRRVYSGPFVRSSYNAEVLLNDAAAGL